MVQAFAAVTPVEQGHLGIVRRDLRHGPVFVGKVPPRDDPSVLRIEDQKLTVVIPELDLYAEDSPVGGELRETCKGDWVSIPLDELSKAPLKRPKEGA